MTALGWELKDLGFKPRLLSSLYALEVQQIISVQDESDVDGSGLAAELKDALSYYDLAEEVAADIVPLTCTRFLQQEVQLLLRAAKSFNEAETIMRARKVLHFAQFVDPETRISADLTSFSELDKSRVSDFYLASVGDSDLEAAGVSAERLRKLINLTEDYEPPENGMDGLLGNADLLSDAKGDNNAMKAKRPVSRASRSNIPDSDGM